MSYLASIGKVEQLNTLSHALGAILAVFGTVVLISTNNDPTFYAVLGIIVYSLTLISMLVVSSMYHAIDNVIWKRRLRILDHINIYYLIAGTYTPVALITLVEGNGWLIFYTVWGMALFGTLLKLFFTGKYEALSLVLYLIMGWLIVLDFENLLDHSSEIGIQLLMLGGAFYTIGIVFYAIRKIPYNHFIWHLFVLAGAISHWFYVYIDVI